MDWAGLFCRFHKVLSYLPMCVHVYMGVYMSLCLPYQKASSLKSHTHLCWGEIPGARFSETPANTGEIALNCRERFGLLLWMQISVSSVQTKAKWKTSLQMRARLGVTILFCPAVCSPGSVTRCHLRIAGMTKWCAPDLLHWDLILFFSPCMGGRTWGFLHSHLKMYVGRKTLGRWQHFLPCSVRGFMHTIL